MESRVPGKGSARVALEEIPALFDRFIREAVAEEQGELEKIMAQVTYEGASLLRNASPKSGDDGDTYARGWKAEKEERDGVKHFLIRQKNDPELTGILELGAYDRYTRDGKSRGTLEPRPHFVPTMRLIINQLKQRTAREKKNRINAENGYT